MSIQMAVRSQAARPWPRPLGEQWSRRRAPAGRYAGRRLAALTDQNINTARPLAVYLLLCLSVCLSVCLCVCQQRVTLQTHARAHKIN